MTLPDVDTAQSFYGKLKAEELQPEVVEYVAERNYNDGIHGMIFNLENLSYACKEILPELQALRSRMDNACPDERTIEYFIHEVQYHQTGSKKYRKTAWSAENIKHAILNAKYAEAVLKVPSTRNGGIDIPE